MCVFSDASAGSLQLFSVLVSHANDSRIRREQQTRLIVLGERVYWVLDLEGSNKMVVLLKFNGTLFLLEVQRADWICPFDGESITNARQHDPWPHPSLFRALTEEEVCLPRTIEEFPGFENYLHEQPNYGFSGLWQAFVRERAQQTGIVIPLLEISITTNSTQPIHNPLALSISVTSPIISLKAPTCASPWTTALRAPTVVVTTPFTTGFTPAGAQRPASEPSVGYLRPPYTKSHRLFYRSLCQFNSLSRHSAPQQCSVRHRASRPVRMARIHSNKQVPREWHLPQLVTTQAHLVHSQKKNLNLRQNQLQFHSCFRGTSLRSSQLQLQ